jgi:hypothetical protein
LIVDSFWRDRGGHRQRLLCAVAIGRASAANAPGRSSRSQHKLDPVENVRYQ